MYSTSFFQSVHHHFRSKLMTNTAMVKAGRTAFRPAEIRRDDSDNNKAPGENRCFQRFCFDQAGVYTIIGSMVNRHGQERNTMMEISEAIAKRKSIRAYQEREVGDEDLAKIVEAGRWAPNAGPFQLTVIRNTALRQRIDQQTYEAMVQSGNDFLQQRAALPGYRPLYGAPVLILLSTPQQAPFGAHNAALAAQNMLLAATGLGLGSCFLVSPTMALNAGANAELAAAAGLPEDHKVQCAVIVGHAAAENKFSAAKRAPKGGVVHID